MELEKEEEKVSGSRSKVDESYKDGGTGLSRSTRKGSWKSPPTRRTDCAARNEN